MQLDNHFPLEAVPSRVRHALLREFKGRCPSLQEVDQISDKHWLATPGIGCTALEVIRSIANAGRQPAATHIPPARLSDGELLRRLAQLQEELKWLEAHVRAQIPKGSGHRPHAYGHNRVARDETDHLLHRVTGTKARRPQSGRDNAA
jgi:hypothetical protein